MKLTEKQIEEIADNLDIGLKCFYNLKTGEIKSILNFDRWMGADREPWEEESKEIDDNRTDYYEFEGFTSHDSFEIMADFAESVDDRRLQDKLFSALNRSKPFRNFKWEIDNSGKYRELWFTYKRWRLKEWIRKQADQIENTDE
jgi:hypothetical protein